MGGIAGRFGRGFFGLLRCGCLFRLGYDTRQHGKQRVEPGALAQIEDRGSEFVHGIAFDHAAAHDAVRGAAAGEEQTEVVVNFRSGGHRGTRIARRVFLLDGNGGRQAVDQVDVGLLDAFEKLPGVGGERFDVAALAFGVDGVKRERGFPRT